MLAAEGFRQRRLRFWQQLDAKPDADYLLLADPIHLTYLANFWVDPISLGAPFRGYLVLRKDGFAKLLCDDRLKKAAAASHVDERRVVQWYDGQSPGKGPRQLA